MEYLIAVAVGGALGALLPVARQHWLPTVAWLALVVAATAVFAERQWAGPGSAAGFTIVLTGFAASWWWARRVGDDLPEDSVDPVPVDSDRS